MNKIPLVPSTVARVQEFHTAFGQKDEPVPKVPGVEKGDPYSEMVNDVLLNQTGVDLGEIAADLLDIANEQKKEGIDPRCVMRLHLITEELSELACSMACGDIVGCLDALTDLQYVVDGTYAALGLAGVKEDAFAEVHRSNMSKLGPDGKPILSEGGRVQKGPNYFKPDLEQILNSFMKATSTLP